MTFGINGAELIVLILLAVLVLGPEKLPEYARKLTGLIRSLRQMAEGAKTQFKEETGTDFDEIDWKKYDPRQYDPRRIIRDALAEPVEGGTEGAAAASVSDGASEDPTAGKPSPSRPSDGLRGDLEAARSERDALRQDLKDLDPRSVLFGSPSRRKTTGTGTAPAATATAAAATAVASTVTSQTPQTSQTTQTSQTPEATGTAATDSEEGTAETPAETPAETAAADAAVTVEAPFDTEAT